MRNCKFCKKKITKEELNSKLTEKEMNELKKVNHTGKVLYKLAQDNYKELDILVNTLEKHLKIVNTEDDGEVFQSILSEESYEELIKKIEDSKQSYA